MKPTDAVGSVGGKRHANAFKIKQIDTIDADFNAAQNISLLGASVNMPEKSNNMCCSIAHAYSGLKPIPSL